jgi:hypothetical protein
MEAWEKNESWMSKCKVELDVSSCSLQIQGVSFQAKIQCYEGELDIELELGWMLRAFQSEIEGKITSWVEEVFGVKC